jgi:hypothetical protein
MAKLLSEKNRFLRDPEKRKRLMVSAIASSQRQEGIEISEARAKEVYEIVFEEPPIAFFRLTEAGEERERSFVSSLSDGPRGIRMDVSRRALLSIDGAPISYWLPGEVLQVFRSLPSLQPGFGEARQGLATADDSRFVRQRWEVDAKALGKGKRWLPFAKGGAYCRFFADIDLVVWWSNNGYDIRQYDGARFQNEGFYLRAGLTWPLRTQRGFNVRVMPAGCIFGHKGPGIFLKDARDTDYLLGVLNSTLAEFLCRALMSFGSYEVGVVQKLPVPRLAAASRKRIATPARHIHDAKEAWDAGNEISSGFEAPWLAVAIREHPERGLAQALDALLAREAAANAEIEARYAELDAAVFEAYGLSSETRATILEYLGPRPPELIWPQMEGKSAEQKRMEHVVRLLSFCVKRIVEGDEDGIVPLVACANEPPLVERVLAALGNLVDAERTHLVEGELDSELRRKAPGYKRTDSIGDFLENAYFEHQVRIYKNRPIFWHLASTRDGGGTPAFAALVHYHRFGKDALRKLRGTYLRSFIERRQRDLGLARRENRTDDALEIQSTIEEAQAFDRRLQGLEEGKYPIRVPWKKASEQPKGWEPDIDDGVKVNILPLQAAGLLRIAKVVPTKGSEEDEG